MGEANVFGSVAGTFQATASSNDVWETMLEEVTGGNPATRISRLEHRWTLIIAFNLNGEADRVVFLVFAVLWLTIFFRLGVLCLMVALGLFGFQIPVPATLSTSVWFAGPSWIVLVLFAAVSVYGFIVSLGGQRAFGKILAEE